MFVFLFGKLRSRKADIKYILPWLLLDGGMMVITAFPGILSVFCDLFGIETPSNMLFFFGLIFLALVVFSMTLVISKQNRDIKDLTQRLALLEDADKSSFHLADSGKDK